MGGPRQWQRWRGRSRQGEGLGTASGGERGRDPNLPDEMSAMPGCRWPAGPRADVRGQPAVVASSEREEVEAAGRKWSGRGQRHLALAMIIDGAPPLPAIAGASEDGGLP